MTERNFCTPYRNYSKLAPLCKLHQMFVKQRYADSFDNVPTIQPSRRSIIDTREWL